MELLFFVTLVIAWMAGMSMGAWLEKKVTAKTLAGKDRKITSLRLMLKNVGCGEPVNRIVRD